MARRGYLHPFIDGRQFMNGVGEEMRTIVELKMNRFSYWIRSIPDWWDIRNDPKVVQQWINVALVDGYLDAVTGEVDPDSYDFTEQLRDVPHLTDRQIQWVLDELPTYARRISHETGRQVSCFERIWEADNLLSNGFRQRICQEIDRCFLQTEASRQSCMRPRKDQKGPIYLDFVHPFDFPFISSRTLCYNMEDGDKFLRRNILNQYFTPIPTEFGISQDLDPGSTSSTNTLSVPNVTRIGYINSLPPNAFFAPLNRLLTDTIQRFVPILEETLTTLHRASCALLAPRIPSEPLKYQRGEDPPDEPGQAIGDGTDDEEDEEMWQAWQEAHRRWVAKRTVVLPDVPKAGYNAPPESASIVPDDSRVSLRGSKIQVSFKLTRIELTPEHPVFHGGDWACEGSPDDHIIVCGLVVLDSHNVTEGTVSLRMAVTRPFITLDDPDSACMAYWGKRRGSQLIQYLGSVRMKPGKCIVHPNIYQHRISPISLIDPSRPGHRTILQIQLVDPELPVISTTEVPPQPASWTMEVLLDCLDRRLPVEIIQKIIDHATEESNLLRDDQRWPIRQNMANHQYIQRMLLRRYFEELF